MALLKIPELLEEEKEVVLIRHDESTLYFNVGAKC